MKKWMRLLAMGCTLALVLSTFAVAAEAEQPLSETQPSLGKWQLHTGARGTDETYLFRMQPGKGTLLRWYCKVSERSEPTHVYLYDVGKGEIVSAMSPQMDPGEERTIVYDVGSDSELCQYRILIESTNGGTVRAYVRANQIHDR